MKIDLNCDLGESFGIYTIGNDEQIMDFVSSVNIACGFHAGDPLIMERTVKMAIDKNVSIGAHPGYPDLQGFGRRAMSMSSDALRAMILYQVGALKTMVEAHGGHLNHVKPHGALYNLASKDYQVALTIAQAIYDIDPQLILLGLSGSEMIRAGQVIGLTVAAETFADRRYDSDLKLVSREIKGAVIKDIDQSIKQCLDIIIKGQVEDINGHSRTIKGDSICIHGDNQKGLDLLQGLCEAFKDLNVDVEALK